jgi:hypothetical protein
MELNKVLKYLDYFSVITVGADKTPNFSWKRQQTEKLSGQKLTEQYTYAGGKKYTDNEGIERELKATTGFGIVTGFEFLECLDIDLKVFSTAKEQKEFWGEFLQNLQDNILDFDDKFIIYKTKNSGYHILYKTKRVEGNLKLAKLKGHKEAVIETRGVGGYIFVYPDNQISKKSYFDIDFITDEEREILFSFARMYNYVQPEKEPIPKKEKQFINSELTVWDDFNQKNNVWDVVSDEFTIVANNKKHIVIKRHNATSAHSGYIFRDTGLMYLFSTGTNYPHEKPISAFYAYTIKFHNGDFSASASALYKQGYGSRIKKEYPVKVEALPINNNDLIFPIDVFPKPIQHYILECNKKLDSNIDYMGCSLLWLISVSIGNAINIEVKRGWVENGQIWISLIGRAGIGKTPSVKNIIFPLNKINSREISNYFKEYEKWEYYNNLPPKEKKESIEINKPIKKQFIANDITLEALVDLHQEADNAVGVFKDELAGWLKDMNKYRAGSDLEFWLSCWSGESVSVNRLTRKGSFVKRPFIPVLGGIQPAILNNFYTEENKDNGFMDRMLLSFPDAVVENYNDNEIDYDIIQWYNDNIVAFYDTIKTVVKRDIEGNIEPLNAQFSPDAKIEWKRIFNEITQHQNSDEENEYLKSMYPKQKSYIPRFALLLHVFNEFFSSGGKTLLIDRESVLKAEKLSKYFIATAKKVKFDAKQVNEIKATAKRGNSTLEKLQLIYEENNDFNRSQAAELLGVSRMQINRLLKQIRGV